jgi:ABC-type dipeptide/oligopeptide/nickel transport system ATPase component
MFSWLQSLVWTFKRVKVYALVGRSGTGKSFRAKLVAEKYQIPLIVDDGLLIQGQKILSGMSAKQAQNYLVAVKTAIFDDPEHLKEVTDSLKEIKFKKILLIGTSKKMVRLIAKKLGFPFISKFISIEEVSTEEEIETALKSRSREGKHVIPVPAMEVKRDYGHILLDSVKIFFQNWAKKGKIIEKAVVRPEFHDQGKISISDSALGRWSALRI